MSEDFLRRWSRLKHQAEKAPAADEAPVAEQKDLPLPPVEMLTPESDFTAFMQPKIEDALRRAALKKLFGDPHFNIPDPFEPYSGDWTVGEPIPPEMLATLNQARTLLFKEEEKEKTEPEQEQLADTKQLADKEPETNEPGRQDS